jgi:hypothetical protein
MDWKQSEAPRANAGASRRLWGLETTLDLANFSDEGKPDFRGRSLAVRS